MNKDQQIEELKDKMGFMESIDMSFVKKGGLVKNIAWGKDYREWPVERRLEFAEALSSALNEGLEVMQNERNIAMEEVLKLRSQLENAQKNLETVQQTNINAITNFNKEKQDMAKRIRELEKEVQDLKIESR